MADPVNIFWFRRDLRLDDNIGFFKALHGKNPVVPVFIFDENILNELPENDARISFIFDELQIIREELQENGSSLAIYYGKPEKILVFTPIKTRLFSKRTTLLKTMVIPTLSTLLI